jgi:ABC-type transport system involved in cytochrome bd biosynthesis fused ATPase/permease subunit
MRNTEDILANDADDLNEDELLKYLEGRLSGEQLHAFEKKMVDSSFINDAVEGLEDFRSKERLQEYVQQLNKNLQQQLQAKKQKKEKRKIKDMPWILLAVVLILLLCMLGYAVLHYYHKDKPVKPPAPATAAVTLQ